MREARVGAQAVAKAKSAIAQETIDARELRNSLGLGQLGHKIRLGMQRVAQFVYGGDNRTGIVAQRIHGELQHNDVLGMQHVKKAPLRTRIEAVTATNNGDVQHAWQERTKLRQVNAELDALRKHNKETRREIKALEKENSPLPEPVQQLQSLKDQLKSRKEVIQERRALKKQRREIAKGMVKNGYDKIILLDNPETNVRFSPQNLNLFKQCLQVVEKQHSVKATQNVIHREVLRSQAAGEQLYAAGLVKKDSNGRYIPTEAFASALIFAKNEGIADVNSLTADQAVWLMNRVNMTLGLTQELSRFDRNLADALDSNNNAKRKRIMAGAVLRSGVRGSVMLGGGIAVAVVSHPVLVGSTIGWLVSGGISLAARTAAGAGYRAQAETGVAVHKSRVHINVPIPRFREYVNTIATGAQSDLQKAAKKTGRNVTIQQALIGLFALGLGGVGERIGLSILENTSAGQAAIEFVNDRIFKPVEDVGSFVGQHIVKPVEDAGGTAINVVRDELHKIGLFQSGSTEGIKHPTVPTPTTIELASNTEIGKTTITLPKNLVDWNTSHANQGHFGFLTNSSGQHMLVFEDTKGHIARIASFWQDSREIPPRIDIQFTSTLSSLQDTHGGALFAHNGVANIDFNNLSALDGHHVSLNSINPDTLLQTTRIEYHQGLPVAMQLGQHDYAYSLPEFQQYASSHHINNVISQTIASNKSLDNNYFVIDHVQNGNDVYYLGYVDKQGHITLFNGADMQRHANLFTSTISADQAHALLTTAKNNINQSPVVRSIDSQPPFYVDSRGVPGSLAQAIDGKSFADPTQGIPTNQVYNMQIARIDTTNLPLSEAQKQSGINIGKIMGNIGGFIEGNRNLFGIASVVTGATGFGLGVRQGFRPETNIPNRNAGVTMSTLSATTAAATTTIPVNPLVVPAVAVGGATYGIGYWLGRLGRNITHRPGNQQQPPVNRQQAQTTPRPRSGIRQVAVQARERMKNITGRALGAVGGMFAAIPLGRARTQRQQGQAANGARKQRVRRNGPTLRQRLTNLWAQQREQRRRGRVAGKSTTPLRQYSPLEMKYSADIDESQDGSYPPPVRYDYPSEPPTGPSAMPVPANGNQESPYGNSGPQKPPAPTMMDLSISFQPVRLNWAQAIAKPFLVTRFGSADVQDRHLRKLLNDNDREGYLLYASAFKERQLSELKYRHLPGDSDIDMYEPLPQVDINREVVPYITQLIEEELKNHPKWNLPRQARFIAQSIYGMEDDVIMGIWEKLYESRPQDGILLIRYIRTLLSSGATNPNVQQTGDIPTERLYHL